MGPVVTTLALRQGTPEWLEGRRSLITGTDIPVLLGISPWKCEADLADEKLGLSTTASTTRMRIGSALEDLNLDEYEALTGRRAVRFRTMIRHPDLEWAAASPDARCVGERRLVEMKWTTSRSRFADGLPQDVAAQVAWQLACTGYPVADVSVLTPDGLMPPFEVAADPALFADLVTIAADFRRRLAEGGPFARDGARIRRDHPADDGTEITADGDVVEAVQALITTRTSRKRLEDDEDRLMSAIQARMGDAAAMRGPGWQITWKRTKDRTDTDWKSLASGLLNALSETDRQTVVGLHSTVKPGFRPFRLSVGKETE